MTIVEERQLVARLLGGEQGATQSLAEHLRRFGPAPSIDRRHAEVLAGEVERAGLTGRGGAGFPAFRKWSTIASSRRRPIVAVNAMEGEPASAKDQLLLAYAPHLVLDGAEAVAGALGASAIALCLPDDRPGLVAHLEERLAERARTRSAVPVEIYQLPARYVAGEETALVSALEGGSSLPAFRADKTVPLRLGRATVLVHNTETLAHVALIARYGAVWFRGVGDPEAPGTCLVSLSGDLAAPGVVEVETGTPLRRILEAGRPNEPVQAVLLGGYGGSWLPESALETPYAPGPLRRLGAVMGAGVLVAVSTSGCGIRETERVVRYLASESAGQCGPCLFGLPALAEDLGRLASGKADRGLVERLERRLGEVDGRGACRHPDGAVRLVRSALITFAPDVSAHLRGAPCAGAHRPTAMVLPPVADWRRQVG
ncbi:MAG: hypothetical protein JWM85_2410 [Acidimicrobiaceae bacterium]|nr:hypothetical protein [Acidimicrobiaceae bacterium]